jgi:hypothetical protein
VSDPYLPGHNRNARPKRSAGLLLTTLRRESGGPTCHLDAALRAAGVPGEIVDQIIGAVAPLADDIVSGQARPESA